MSVSQRIDPNLCSAWMLRELSANVVLMGLVKGRFYKGDAVPTPQEGLVYPFIYWTGGVTSKANFYDKERETIARIVSRFAVRVQNRFDGRPAGNWDSEFYHQMRSSLTGIKASDVAIGGQKIGSIHTSRWIDDYASDERDNEARILESGLLIEVMHL